MDEQVAQFTAFTDADPAKAQNYLQLTDGNVEQAVQLYFENPDLDFGGVASPQTSHPAATTTNQPATQYEDEEGVIHLDSDNEAEDPFGVEDSPPPVPRRPDLPSVDDDEAMARRLQEEMYGGGAGAMEDVRAPIARTAETLIGPGANFDDEGDMHAAVLAQQRLQQARRRLGMVASFIFGHAY
jgi:UBX domain-containing protein 7